MIDHLTSNDIVHLNERTIRAHGGSFTPPENLREEEALNALTDEASSDNYPRLADKAAFYLHAIITRNVFLDANESTALLAARTFVFMNGGAFHKKLKVVTDNDRQIPEGAAGDQAILLKLLAEVSSGSLSLEDVREWFGRNVNA